MIINFGCGLKKLPGAVNVDYTDIVKPDVKWDLNNTPYPFESESADQIVMSHVLEHIDNVGGVLSECNRILKWGGELIVEVPHHSCDMALGDKYHRRIISPETFYYGSLRSGEDIQDSAGYALAMEKMSVRFGKETAWLQRFPRFVIDFCVNHLRNFAKESVFVLRKVKKKVALSFDDGPSEFTPGILDSLEKIGAKATFFLLGANSGKRPEIVKAILDKGHDIGIHGFTHQKWLNREIVQHEVRDSLKTFNKILPGYKIKYFRPPYMQRYAKLYPENLRIPELKNMTCVDYTTISNDWNKTTPYEIVSNTMNLATDGGVVLLHDGYHEASTYRDRTATCEAVIPLHAALINNGFKILTIGELDNEPRLSEAY